VKKIVCPRCGVVNLEKFVTFPHCAGCSALLPQAREPSRASIWRRPLRAGFWASLVGLALAGVVALSFSEPERGEPQQLIVYPQLSRHVHVGGVLVCRIGLESVRSDGREPDVLRDVSWQLPVSVERDWRVVSVSPTPDEQTRRVGKPLWIYHRWPSEERWSLRLQPRSSGRRLLAITANAADHFPIQWRTIVTVR